VKVSEARSVETDCCDLIFTIPGRQQYKAGNYVTEGDWSNAAFLYALKKISGKGELYQNSDQLTITGLNPSSSQGDRVCPELMDSISRRGTEKALDISGCPDLGPVLMAFGAAMDGCHLTGTARLRIKESDRGQAMAQELAKFGIEVRCGENDIKVFPGKLQKPVEILRGHNDHRIVMSLAVLSTITGGTIDDAEAVSKSWPDFWHVLFSLGIHVDLEN
jgi:3-phosphoshikimate 1-carboxyvinyltransferase